VGAAGRGFRSQHVAEALARVAADLAQHLDEPRGLRGLEEHAARLERGGEQPPARDEVARPAGALAVVDRGGGGVIARDPGAELEVAGDLELGLVCAHRRRRLRDLGGRGGAAAREGAGDRSEPCAHATRVSHARSRRERAVHEAHATHAR
jgi:hypothetical protein